MKVKSWMTSNLITVTPDTGVIDAFLLLKEDNISQLPVVRDGKPVGIITYQKLLYLPVGKTVRLPHNTYKIYILNANLSVSGFMTSPPVTIQENSPLESASLMLHNKKINGLLVTSTEGKLAGIITVTDVLKAFIDILRLGENPFRIGIAYTEESEFNIAKIIEIVNLAGGKVQLLTGSEKKYNELIIFLWIKGNENLIITNLKKAGVTIC